MECSFPVRLVIIFLLHILQSALAFRRVCYFTNWSRDLQQAGGRFQLSDVEPFLCTHLLYAFAAVHPDNATLAPIVTRQMDTEQEELQRYLQFNALKTVNKDLRTLLSVGGSIQANEDFVQVVSTEEGRRKFAANTVKYLRTWDFDGLDIDWEYPGNPPDTKRNFTLLLQELRLAFQADATSHQMAPLLLSVAAPVSEEQMNAGYEIEEVSSLVDFINLMAYDFHGSWNSITSFNSPLYGRRGDPRFSPDLSVNWAVQAWLQKGAVAEKLVLGIAGYGQSFTLRNASLHAVGSPTAGPGIPGRWRRMTGQLAYFEVCELQTAGGERVWDDLQRVPYVYLQDQWVGYDDPDSIKDKVDFAVGHSLGGAMLWSLDMDDFRGAFCGKGRYPLLTAMVKAIGDHFPDVEAKLLDQTTHPHPGDMLTSTLPLPDTTAPPFGPGVSTHSTQHMIPPSTRTTTTTIPKPATTSTTRPTISTTTTSRPKTTTKTSTTTTIQTTTTRQAPTTEVVVITKQGSGSDTVRVSFAALLARVLLAVLAALHTATHFYM